MSKITKECNGNGAMYPPVLFELTNEEAETLRALPLTAFTLDPELPEASRLYANALIEVLKIRGYAIYKRPTIFKEALMTTKYGILIQDTPPKSKKQDYPGWSRTSFFKLIEVIRIAEFQASILFWNGKDNKGDLPMTDRAFRHLTPRNSRGFGIAHLAYGEKNAMLRSFHVFRRDQRQRSPSVAISDVYMESPGHTPGPDDSSSINRILKYSPRHVTPTDIRMVSTPSTLKPSPQGSSSATASGSGLKTQTSDPFKGRRKRIHASAKGKSITVSRSSSPSPRPKKGTDADRKTEWESRKEKLGKTIDERKEKRRVKQAKWKADQAKNRGIICTRKAGGEQVFL